MFIFLFCATLAYGDCITVFSIHPSDSRSFALYFPFRVIGLCSLIFRIFLLSCLSYILIIFSFSLYLLKNTPFDSS